MRSGTRAIVPSSFMTSQITPAGVRPASRARSTAASVCPVRSSTPPGLDFNGNTWPGWTRARGRVDGDLDRARPVGRGDAGGHAVAGLDGDGEGRLEGRLVLGRHQVEAELVAALRGQGQADQPAAVLGHEVDRLGRDELGRHREVALVLAVLVVADDDHAAGPDLLDRLLDGSEGTAHGTATISFSTYLASTSTSRLTGVPGAAAPRLVRSRVSGISDTENVSAVTLATVRETPSTAIEPFSTT